MRKPYLYLFITVILMAGLHAGAYAQDQTQLPTIDVTGKGTIIVEPNTAVITFSVETSEKKAEDALKKNAQQMKTLMDAIKNATAEQATISTSNFNVYPLYERDSGSKSRTAMQSPVAYRVNNSLTVKTSGIEEIGLLIDTAVDAGANRIGSLSFTRDDLDRLQRQAAAKALENAMEYGEELAKTAGLAIKKILYIHYVPGGAVYDYQRMALAEEGVPTPVSPGRIPVESYVNVSFSVEPVK